MKILFTAIATILTTAAFCQSTTQIEYNYMKNGYREVEEKGLDVKKGYTVEDLPAPQYSDLTMTVTLLRRTNNTIAGIILKTVSTSAFGSGTNYYCIPAVSTENKPSYGWELFQKDVQAMTSGQRNAVINWLAYRVQYELGK